MADLSEERTPFAAQLLAYAKGMDIPLGEEQAEVLHRFWRFLQEENERHNLTAIVQDEEAVIKHFLDSLTVLLAGELEAGSRLVDIGSGAGFPGIPLAVAAPAVHVALVESTGKKANFLRQAAERLGLNNVEVVHRRAEEAAHEAAYREGFDVAVARALAPLPVACEWCLPFVKVGGRFVAMRGAAGLEDLEAARGAMAILGAEVDRILELELPGGAGRRVLVVMRKVKPVGKEYPRRGGQARRKPLA